MPVAVTVPALSVNGLPVQTVVAEGVIPVIVGRVFTVTEGEVTAAVLVQPVPGYVTVKLYTPLAAVVVGVNAAVVAVPVVL